MQDGVQASERFADQYEMHFIPKELYRLRGDSFMTSSKKTKIAILSSRTCKNI